MSFVSTLALVLQIALLASGRAAWSGVVSDTDGDAARCAVHQEARSGHGDYDSASKRSEGKLVLKDGTYQLVRNYEKNGERVRYFSVERGAWEEIPAAMVDWDATKQAEAAERK